MLPYEAHCYKNNLNGNSYSNDVDIDVDFRLDENLTRFN